MSCYKDLAIHPTTKLVEYADWIDDCFGQYHYGVQFSDGAIFRASDVSRPAPEELARRYNYKETSQC